MKIAIIIILSLLSTSAAPSTCRSASIKHQFDKLNGYPHGRPGFVVDHICPLQVGGVDDINNLQYQTYAESKAKDKIERTEKGIAMFCNLGNSLPVRTVFNCK